MLVINQKNNADIEFYMDDNLYRQIETKIKPDLERKDKDCVYLVCGEERVGKSVFAMQLGKAVDPSLSIDRITFSPDEFTDAIRNAEKGQCIIYDEAFTGLSNRSALSRVNKSLISMMMEMGQKNLMVIIVLPSFFMLDQYAALHRSRGLFYIYTKNGERGYWLHFNKK